MAEVKVNKRMNVSTEKAFACWNDDYENIYKFNPNLKHSKLLNNSPRASGVGALRRCDMADGKNWINEKVLKSEKNKQLVIDIYEGTLPFKSAIGTIDFRTVNPHQTDVSFTMSFKPKMGIIGLILIPLMKRMFKPSLQALLDGNADFLEHGKQVNQTVAA